MPNNYETLYHFQGQEPGGKSFVLGGVHPNEKPALYAVEELVDNLLKENTIKRGDLYGFVWKRRYNTNR